MATRKTPAMAKIKPHRKLVKGILRAERARSGLKFEDISAQLASYGIQQSASNLSNKVAAGHMEAGLFLAILDVLGVPGINVRDLIADLKARPPRGSARPRGTKGG